MSLFNKLFLFIFVKLFYFCDLNFICFRFKFSLLLVAREPTCRPAKIDKAAKPVAKQQNRKTAKQQNRPLSSFSRFSRLSIRAVILPHDVPDIQWWLVLCLFFDHPNREPTCQPAKMANWPGGWKRAKPLPFLISLKCHIINCNCTPFLSAQINEEEKT